MIVSFPCRLTVANPIQVLAIQVLAWFAAPFGRDTGGGASLNPMSLRREGQSRALQDHTQQHARDNRERRDCPIFHSNCHTITFQRKVPSVNAKIEEFKLPKLTRKSARPKDPAGCSGNGAAFILQESLALTSAAGFDVRVSGTGACMEDRLNNSDNLPPLRLVAFQIGRGTNQNALLLPLI